MAYGIVQNKHTNIPNNISVTSNDSLLYNYISDAQKSKHLHGSALNKAISEFVSINSINQNMLLKIANIAFSAHMFTEAAQLLHQAIKLGLRDYNSFFKLGQTYNRLGNNDQSLAAFLKALHYKPGCVHTRMAIGRIFHQKAKDLTFNESPALFERTKRMALYYYNSAIAIDCTLTTNKIINDKIELEGLLHSKDEKNFSWLECQEIPKK